MDKILTLIFFLFSGILLGQDKYPKMSFEIGYNYQLTKMEEFNKYFMDSSFMKYSDIHSIFNYLNNPNLELKIRPNPQTDFGISVGGQYKTKTGKPILNGLDEDLNVFHEEGLQKLSLRSWDIAITNTWYINQIFDFWNQSNIINRFDFGINLHFGYKFISLLNEYHVTTFTPTVVSNGKWKSNCFYGKLGVKIEYTPLSKTLFSSIGLTVGYQFNNKETMRYLSGETYIKMPYKKSINLDFSGLYFGVYLKISK